MRSGARLLGVGVIAAWALTLLGPGMTGEPETSPAPVDLVAGAQSYLRAHPGDARTWATLGGAYLQRLRATGDPAYLPKAEGALTRSLKLRPDHVDALVAMGTLANARHDFASGLAWGKRARAVDPDRSTVYGVLTDAHVELGHYHEADSALQRMLDLRPDVASFTRAAHLRELRGRRAEAAEALRRAVGAATAPEDLAYCHYRLGELSWSLGDPAGALRAYELALGADSGHALSLAGRARAQAALGRTEDAVAGYRSAIARSPLPQFGLELGELLTSLGRQEEAARQFATLAAQERLHRAAGVLDDLTLGQYEADHGDAARAVRHLRAEWARRRSVDVADALGWALHRAGRSGEALRYARLAGRLGGRNAAFAFHRGQIERALGHDAAARAHLARALAVNPYFSPLRSAQAAKVLAGNRGEP